MKWAYMLMDLVVSRVHLILILRSCRAYCGSIRASIERHLCTVSIRQFIVRDFNLFFN